MESRGETYEAIRGPEAETNSEMTQLLENQLREGARGISKHSIRPVAVAFLSVYHLACAAVLILVFTYTLLQPDTQWASPPLWGAVYVASHGSGQPSYFTLIPIAYGLTVSFGLWNLKSWAKRLAMLVSGLSAVRWIRYLALNSLISGTELGRHVESLKPGFQQQSVYALILSESLIFCCLAFYPGVPEAFRNR